MGKARGSSPLPSTIYRSPLLGKRKATMRLITHGGFVLAGQRRYATRAVGSMISMGRGGTGGLELRSFLSEWV